MEVKTELKVIWTIQGEWEKVTCQSHVMPIMKSWNSGIKVGDSEGSESPTTLKLVARALVTNVFVSGRATSSLPSNEGEVVYVETPSQSEQSKDSLFSRSLQNGASTPMMCSSSFSGLHLMVWSRSFQQGWRLRILCMALVTPPHHHQPHHMMPCHRQIETRTYASPSRSVVGITLVVLETTWVWWRLDHG